MEKSGIERANDGEILRGITSGNKIVSGGESDGNGNGNVKKVN